ncbi:uncharacterized protein [Temnothorax nylanderi]|uniref:uncharacterized protein isoform X1 n=1 Tax=Temnothorax nylanderi TaxID=102681 RepID=UPI003A86D140
MRFHSKESRPSDDARITARSSIVAGRSKISISGWFLYYGFDTCCCKLTLRIAIGNSRVNIDVHLVIYSTYIFSILPQFETSVWTFSRDTRMINGNTLTSPWQLHLADNLHNRQDSARGLPSATMSDEGFNPCECMWNYLSVQHLLSILRQSQDYCSDTECFSISRLPGPQTNVRESSDFLFTCLMIGFMVLLYAFRPSLRRSTRNIIKSSNEPGSHGDGPPSPPTMN